MSKDSKPEKLSVDQNIITQLQLGELRIQNIQLQNNILLIEHLNRILDPDHIYRFDFKEKVFLKTEKKVAK